MHTTEVFSGTSGSSGCCRTCGTALAQRPMEGQGTILVFCPTRQCPLYGLPSWRRPSATVVLDDGGSVVTGVPSKTIAQTMRDSAGLNRPEK